MFSLTLSSFQAAYESQQDIQLIRFADFFARFFASVSAPQFSWVNMFKESPVAKIAAVSLFCPFRPISLWDLYNALAVKRRQGPKMPKVLGALPRRPLEQSEALWNIKI
ncbi:hypothetical protein GW17_00010256 [Ensete ventricosum]|nr:hypothetical protein GW17_00010256 [Ensete ventricosum]